MKPTCSVLIPNYNGESIISSCIQSVISQVGDVSTEIIVHDDASTDASEELIREQFPQIELLVSDQNVGFSESCNRIARLAKGDYLLFLNNDAELFPDAVQTLVRHAATQQHPGILSLAQYAQDGESILDFGIDVDFFLTPFLRKSRGDGRPLSVHGACMWVPVNLWKQAGGFPKWFGSIAEDLYLCCFAWSTGFSVEIPESSGYRHRVGYSLGGGKVVQNKLSSTYRRRFLSERNRLYTALVLYPWYAFPLLWIHFIYTAMEGLLLSIVMRKAEPLKQIYLPAISQPILDRENWQCFRRRVRGRQYIRFGRIAGKFRVLPSKVRMLFRNGLPRLQ